MALTDNLVASWRFNESSGNALDSSGNGYTLTNRNTCTYSAGKINNAVNFVKSSSQDLTISAGTGSPFNTTTGNYSLSFWYKPASNISTGEVFFIYDRGSTFDIYHQKPGGTEKITFYFGGSYVDYNVTLSAGTWYHFVAVRNGSSSYVYLNNSLVATGSATSSSSNSNAVYIGSQAGSNYCNGSIDATNFFTRAVTTDDIATLYNSGNGYEINFTSIKTINGLAYSSVKTVNGLATSSVKTINGLA